MSLSEQLFFDPGGLDLCAAATELARAAGGRIVDNDTGFGIIVTLDELEPGAFLVGPVSSNPPVDPLDPDDPLDKEVFNALPMKWSIRYGPRKDEGLLRGAGMRLFTRLTTSGLTWPLVLALEYDELIATYDVERGVREFPPGTRSDGTDEHLWR